MTPAQPSLPPPTSAVAALPTARVAAILCTLAIALQLIVPSITAALGPGSSRSLLILLFLFALPGTYIAAGSLAALALARTARFALVARREAGILLPLVLVVVGLASAFAAPAAWVLLLGEGSSLFWYLVYGIFLPASLLGGAQLSMFGATLAIRMERWASVLTAIAIPVVGVGSTLLIYTIARSFVPESLAVVGIIVSSFGLALDVAVAVRMGRTLRGTWAVIPPGTP